MRFLLDENLSPSLVGLLTTQGHDVTHIRDLGMRSAPDEEVLDAAAAQRRVLISADTDFGAILASRGSSRPSVLLIRRVANRRAVEQAGVILSNLASIADDLDGGAIVVLGERSLRIRRLPL